VTITLSEFLATPELSGPEWQKPTREPWRVLAKCIDGLPLSRAEVRLLKACTGLQRIPRNVRLLVLLIGRRGGKSQFLAAFAVWVALFAQDWREVLSPGERGVVLLLAPERKQAAILARYAAGICQGDLIAPEVVRQTADEIEFSTGAVIEVGVSDYRGLRGRTCLAIIFDEACFAASEGASPLEEVVAAAEPSMATIPGGGWLLLSSSPWKPAGLMHKRWRELHGDQATAEATHGLCWVAPSRVMNPNLPKAYIERKLAEDPVRNRAEYVVDPSAPWRSTDADFVPDDVIQGCTDWEVRERPPQEGTHYFAFTDPAGGTGADSFCLGIAHLEADGRAVLDCLRERKPRFVPSAVVGEYADVLKSYGVTSVTGDHWAKGFVKDEFERRGITYRPSKRTRSEIYLAGLPLLLSGRARLLDIARLRQQLAGLERKVRAAGREEINHGSGKGDHDDAVNCAIGALVLAVDRPAYAPPAFGTYSRSAGAHPLVGRHAPRVPEGRPSIAEELPPPAWVRNPATAQEAENARRYWAERVRA
jgi:hypothetical protein